MNYKKLNLLKNFNHVIKEIIEKDLDLSVNIETVNILKNEFLADLPVTNERKIIDHEDKENIDLANIQQVVKPAGEKSVQLRKNSSCYKKKTNPSNRDREYHYNHHPQSNNHFNYKTNNHVRRNGVFREEGLRTQNNNLNHFNRFPSFYEKNSYQSSYRGNLTSLKKNKGNSSNSHTFNVYNIYEESIYVTNTERDIGKVNKANM